MAKALSKSSPESCIVAHKVLEDNNASQINTFCIREKKILR